MTTITVTNLAPGTPRRLTLRRAHFWPLAIVLVGALLLYAETTARFGQALAVADAHLYYAHAHSWYFDGDCDYENNIGGNPALEVRDYYLAQRAPSGRVVNIFPCGWSIVAMPFLALADGLTTLHNIVAEEPLPRDGYSAYYRAVVPLAHVLLGLIGLWAGYIVTARYFSRTIAAWSTAAVWLGTNASYFISVEPTMSHAASLGFVALMILACDNIHGRGWSLPRALALGLSCGMAVAVRHQNIAWIVVPWVLLGPSIAQSTWNQSPRWHRPWGYGVVAALAFALCMAPQVGVNLATQGTVMGQLGGYMPDWLHPEFRRELFAVPTGLFVLYPLSGLCVAGGLALAWHKRRLPLARALVAGGVAFFYMNACAAYGPSRRYTCCAVFFMLGLAATMHGAKGLRWRSALLAAVVILCCAGNLVLLLMADRCLVDRALFTACPVGQLDLIQNVSRLVCD